MTKEMTYTPLQQALAVDQLEPSRSTTSRLFSEKPLLITRTFFSVCYLFVFIFHILNGPDEAYLYLGFLTYLSYYGIFAYVLVSTYLSWRAYLCPSTYVPWKNQHWIFPFLYFLHYELNTLLAFVVTAVYWSLLASDDLAANSSPMYLFLSVSMHAVNSVIMWSEAIFGNNPIVLRHFPIILFITLIYVPYAFVLHARYGIWIYPFLDYVTDPKTTVLTILGIVVISSSFYGATYILHSTRDKHIARRNSHQAYDITA
ncbi:hypothetical protein DSO57_1014870 [Entomophthora muscae]|uniref:Uncharacterized protein n=1 Tax=Entomophthora muscae TaxID=34485 RepID=A0ACC2TSY1_9FUNG|nr:hypothetical protein DSO57_1014870 [Entomophthora muscae]